MTDKLGKCRPDGRTFCEGMKLAQPGHDEGKGLSIAFGWTGDSPAAARPRYIGILYRTKAKAQGVFLNLCPWCGERLFPAEAPAQRPG